MNFNEDSRKTYTSFLTFLLWRSSPEYVIILSRISVAAAAGICSTKERTAFPRALWVSLKAERGSLKSSLGSAEAHDLRRRFSRVVEQRDCRVEGDLPN